ncbi:hypothetical protein NUW54_g7117 [Trametes sanguinea]|uniref:Uncharacterized protein n=1 Tax=Trametes sanguinea TaxID=158606 RepID=A0ACC1PRZ3_9APHY|nr:hypothetical protein NUW54_g7117 [Trametes sanguinea]
MGIQPRSHPSPLPAADEHVAPGRMRFLFDPARRRVVPLEFTAWGIASPPHPVFHAESLDGNVRMSRTGGIDPPHYLSSARKPME